MIFILLIVFIDMFFPRVTKGRLIMKINRLRLKNKYLASIIWGFLVIGWGASYVADVSRHNENNLYTINEFSIYWAIFSFFNAIRAFIPIEIREKGIIVHDGMFYKFQKINFYTLKSPYIITFNYKSLLKENDDYDLEFKNEEDAMRFHEILHRYVTQHKK
ncbi:hypothetical protein ACPWSR_07460 [Alloiococcus sp. CFN-8]|uniref:hypothetical protein n=1 Tax=Alloiococcus sp. CFN-8 TaxID=3416081 RepID=UPI003CF3D1AF